MRIESSYPSPVHGVSTLAPRNRARGYANEQINFRSDPVNKLTKRPALKWVNYLTTVSDPSKVMFHSYERDGKEYSFLIDKTTGDVGCYIEGVFSTTVNLGGYSGDNIKFYSIEHDTYVVNTDVVVELDPQVDTNEIERVTHINVISALNYGETIEVGVGSLGDSPATVISYSVPDLGLTEPDYDTADKARATKEVASQIASILNAEPWFSGSYTAIATGSSVAVWADDGDWVDMYVTTGQGDRSITVINKVIENTDGLPLYAVHDTRITVRPNPISDKGVYYLSAQRVADDPSNPSKFLEEVVWVESRNPDEPYSFVGDTIPKVITFDGTFTLNTMSLKDRRTGDNDSVKVPKFVGSTITTLGYFQKRLVLVSDNNVSMSETDDAPNFWKQSALKLLVSDTVSVASSALGIDSIKHLVPHNRDLLCITSNAQFKIDGSVAITPETASMTLTTRYECTTVAEPMGIGNFIYLPMDYGTSAGVLEYTGQANTTQDVATSITNHIIGYMNGNIVKMEASPNLEIGVVKTDKSLDNELFVYEQFHENGKRLQSAWCRWVFDEDIQIVDYSFRRNKLVLVTAQGSNIIRNELSLYSNVAGSRIPVTLDNMLVLPTDGATVTKPAQYPITDDTIIVRGDGTLSELHQVKFTQQGNTLTLAEDIGVGEVYVGLPFKSSYTPTRPFRYGEDGTTITTDRLRVGKYIVSLVDTYEVTMCRETPYTETTKQVFTNRLLSGYKLGELSLYTGDWAFAAGENAKYLTATFESTSYLGCSITDISWEGQYHASKRRM